jgi:hypothetical protein
MERIEYDERSFWGRKQLGGCCHARDQRKPPDTYTESRRPLQNVKQCGKYRADRE